jgi:glutamate synthase domain-containing protein 3
MVELDRLNQAEDINLVRDLIVRHVSHTGSPYAAGILDRWVELQAKFVKVTPKDFKRVLLAESRARAEGREPTFTELVGAGG